MGILKQSTHLRDERDFGKRCDYSHYNPVRHQLCSISQDWQFSTIHRLIAQRVYPPNWGMLEISEILKAFGSYRFHAVR